MNTYNINIPISNDDIRKVKSGDLLYLSGYLYTARDAAHKRLVESIEKGKADIEINGETIYYVGPTPAFKDYVIGSCGPTTSVRMDKYVDSLLSSGLKIMIGKGDRSDEVIRCCEEYQALYLIATGGVGALLSKCIEEYEELIYQDLGPESIKRLKVKNFPVYVAYDTYGNNIFRI